jgi:DNA-binding XRE family transcriptional regulator
MNAVKILSQTQDTVTVSRVVWARLLSELEDVEDRAAVVERRRREARGKQATCRNYLTAREARRLLDGESPVKVWREKRGRSQRELAAAARVSAGYLAEIETGRKPGSVAALARLAKALQVQVEDLISSN